MRTHCLAVLAALLAASAAGAQTRIPTPQDIRELNQHRDPAPTDEYLLRQARIKACQEKARSNEEADRCVRTGGQDSK